MVLQAAWQGISARVNSIKIRRMHWLVSLVGTIPALFADLFFRLDSLNSIQPNKLLFTPELGYIFIALLVFNVINARENAFIIRILTSTHLLFGAIISFGSTGLHISIISCAYIISCFAALLAFIAYGRVGNLRFLIFATLLFFLGVFAPFISVSRVAIALALIGVGRLAIRVIQENTNFFTVLGRKKAAELALLSLAFWVPFGVLIALSSFATNQAQKLLEDYIYQENIIARCPGTATQNLRVDIECTIDASSKLLADEILQKTKAAIASTTGEVATYPERLRVQLEGTIEREPAPLRPARCSGFLPVGCWIANSIKRGAMRSYQAARAAAIAKLHEEALQAARSVNSTAAQVGGSIDSKLPEVAATSAEMLKRSVRGAFNVLDILSIIFNVMLIFAAFKSYVYIFARLAHQNAAQIFIQTKRGPIGKQKASSIESNATIVSVAVNGRSRFYKARNVPSANFPPSISLPFPASAPLARFFSWRYALDLSGPTSLNARQIIFNSHQGRGFVKWQLHSGESIIINDFSRVLLFEDTCRIRTKVSLRLSTLLLGKMLFPAIEGPGIVVFYTTGPAAVGQAGAYEVGRFVAWREDVGFNVVASPGLLNTYLSGIQLAATNNQAATVVDPTAKLTWFGGAGRFIRSFLLPF